jgi:hypothetical protein
MAKSGNLSSRQAKKTAPLRRRLLKTKTKNFDYSEFLSVGAGLNPTVLLALILISSPVWGLRPFLALRFLTVNVPKLGYANLFSFLIALDMFSKAASRTSPVNRLDKFASLQVLITAVINSSLVTDLPSFSIG